MSASLNTRLWLLGSTMHLATSLALALAGLGITSSPCTRTSEDCHVSRSAPLSPRTVSVSPQACTASSGRACASRICLRISWALISFVGSLIDPRLSRDRASDLQGEAAGQLPTHVTRAAHLGHVGGEVLCGVAGVRHDDLPVAQRLVALVGDQAGTGVVRGIAGDVVDIEASLAGHLDCGDHFLPAVGAVIGGVLGLGGFLRAA